LEERLNPGHKNCKGKNPQPGGRKKMESVAQSKGGAGTAFAKGRKRRVMGGVWGERSEKNHGQRGARKKAMCGKEKIRSSGSLEGGEKKRKGLKRLGRRTIKLGVSTEQGPIGKGRNPTAKRGKGLGKPRKPPGKIFNQGTWILGEGAHLTWKKISGKAHGEARTVSKNRTRKGPGGKRA